MKRKVVLGVLTLIVLLGIAMLTSTGIYGEPQGKPDIEVIVSTGSSTYVEGEDIEIFVIARNVSGKKVTLPSRTAYEVDYTIDDQYRWNDDKRLECFPGFITVELIKDGTCTFTFVHKSKDYHLSSGKHKIVGEVVGVGEDSCMIEVVPR